MKPLFTCANFGQLRVEFHVGLNYKMNRASEFRNLETKTPSPRTQPNFMQLNMKFCVVGLRKVVRYYCLSERAEERGWMQSSRTSEMIL